ncbi:MAG: hypothetical protein AAGD01_15465 [Acidobacteriota bacterium]
MASFLHCFPLPSLVAAIGAAIRVSHPLRPADESCIHGAPRGLSTVVPTEISALRGVLRQPKACAL